MGFLDIVFVFSLSLSLFSILLVHSSGLQVFESGLLPADVLFATCVLFLTFIQHNPSLPLNLGAAVGELAFFLDPSLTLVFLGYRIRLISILQAGPDLITRFFPPTIFPIGALDKMHVFLFLAIFFSLSFNVLSMPVAPQKHLRGRSFKVERVKRNDYVAHGPTALRKAYRKFGIDVSSLKGIDVSDFKPFDTKPVVTQAKKAKEAVADDEQTGAVDATSVDGDVEFVSPVNIGGQTLDMNFDSGSADM